MTSESTGELSLRLVGDIDGAFWVPAYQRGFRWGSDQIRPLLNDIWEHATKAGPSETYCLQPIVVTPRPDGRIELIDGQQRLTTLYLLFLYMKRQKLQNADPPFSIEYETRPGSRQYLETLSESERDKNMDFFHLHHAFACISDWFDVYPQARRQHVANKMYASLFEQVKVIWYEAGSEIDPVTLFTRLNVGRIPLTNAELVKALLLARRSIDGGNDHAQAQRLKQLEIATRWDTIERELHEENFWAFLSNDPPPSTRVELLFDMMSLRPIKGDPFHTFFFFKSRVEERALSDGPMAQVDAASLVWGEVSRTYALLRGWYTDRDIYHKVGYLVSVGESLAGLVAASDGINKTAFQKLLHGKIVAHLDLASTAVEDLSYERPGPCKNVLELMNIESVRSLRNSSERYPFDAHKRAAWSLEHIHAQNAERLNTKAQWQEWLDQHRQALALLRIHDDHLAAARDVLVSRINLAMPNITREAFDRLSADVVRMFSPGNSADAAHQIDNLALLPSEANAALGNAVFEVKRRRIIELDRKGIYIPISTRRVFLKYYSPIDGQQVHFWSEQDRQAYMDAMFSTEGGLLTPYLKDAAENVRPE